MVLDRASIESYSKLEMSNSQQSRLRFDVGLYHLRLIVVRSIFFCLRDQCGEGKKESKIDILLLMLSPLLQDLQKNLHIGLLIALYLLA